MLPNRAPILIEICIIDIVESIRPYQLLLIDFVKILYALLSYGLLRIQVFANMLAEICGFTRQGQFYCIVRKVSNIVNTIIQHESVKYGCCLCLPRFRPIDSSCGCIILNCVLNVVKGKLVADYTHRLLSTRGIIPRNLRIPNDIFYLYSLFSIDSILNTSIQIECLVSRCAF